jgi:hypothetical protein
MNKKTIFILIVLAILIVIFSNFNKEDNTNETSTTDTENNRQEQVEQINEEESAEDRNDLLTQFQGRWVSDEDEKYVIEIEDNKILDIYDDKVLGIGEVKFIEQCADQKIDPTKPHFTFDFENFNYELCYELIEVTEDKLAYFFMPDGNVLSFTKTE